MGVTPLHIIALMILFFMSLFKLFLNNSFIWLKAFLAIQILVLISVSHLPSLVVRASRYLNRSTCSSLSPSIVMFISPSPFLDTFMTFVFFMFTFMSYSFAVLSIGLHPSVFADLLPMLQSFLFHSYNFSTHINLLSRDCFYQLRQLRTVTRSLTASATATLVHAFVANRLDYCSSLYAGLPACRLACLDRVLRSAARLIGGIPK